MKYIIIAAILLMASTCFADDSSNAITPGVNGSVISQTQDQTIYSNFSFIAQKRGNSTDPLGAVANGTELGYFASRGWDGTAYRIGPYIRMVSRQAWSSSSVHGGAIHFFCQPNSTTGNVLCGYADQNSKWRFGSNNNADGPTATVNVKDGTASTGTTQVLIEGGAAVAEATTNKLFVITAGAGNSTTKVFYVTGAGHTNVDSTIGGGGTNLTPVLTSCGTSPTIVAGSTDSAGTFTMGATGTGCVITFAVAYTNTPSCTVQGQTLANLTSYTKTNTAITLVGLPGTFDYRCNGLAEP